MVSICFCCFPLFVSCTKLHMVAAVSGFNNFCTPRNIYTIWGLLRLNLPHKECLISIYDEACIPTDMVLKPSYF
ncbi:hypothetical protein V8B97DRAFT_1982775 [Scleroderma yunnanense]